MTDTQKKELKFYLNGSAKSVLKKFIFTEKEVKLIEDAIRTAKMANPRMKLIRDTDALLREVVKTKEPIISIEKVEIPTEAIAKFELLKLSTIQIKEDLAYKENSPSFFGVRSKYGIIAVILMAIGMMAVEYFSVKPMHDEMQRHRGLIRG